MVAVARYDSTRHSSNPSQRYARTDRVNEVLREVIAECLKRAGDDDERLDMVTITSVEVDPDLRRAQVYFSALGTSASSDDVIEALESRRKGIQHAINDQVHLKRTPQLQFVPDEAIEGGLRVEEILRNLSTNGSDARDAE